MASLIACAESGFEPIPGYVLRKKLGAGGYGEVWLADAPGGLKKAIKFVFGSLDDNRAASELKALQRIRQVNHPFLLSLERIEILEGQLIIVTELADGSLCDQFAKCRENGSVGIPRDQLLDYLRDAADALDFLCQKHDLQHLDIKPANLLLVADRVKVADFGLVKDVQCNSMSMLGGMTPSYAAPEMFDGRPGRFSDQYSLAIVYQELLTGTLPFGGRTTAQLASEHLHRAPNLEPVPPMDRPILAKALAKKATQRYGSCREFVDHLLASDRISAPNAVSAIANPTPSPVQDAGTRNPARPAFVRDPDAGKTSQVDHGTSTQTFEKREVEVLPPIEGMKNLADPCVPTLFLGLGGTGAEMLTELRTTMEREGVKLEERTDLAWLLIDTDRKELDTAVDEQTHGHLPYQCTLHLPLKPAQYYREQEEAIFSPLSRRWLYNVPRSRTTEGIRPLGMLALLDHSDVCYKVLGHYIQQLNQYLKRIPSATGSESIRIYLLGSAHGGTGSAILGELAFLLRRTVDENQSQAIIQAILTVGESSERASNDLMGASATACLSELSHYVRTGGLHPGLPSLAPSHAAPRPPIDHLYAVHGGRVGDQQAWEVAIHQVVDFVYADSCTPLGTVLQECRTRTYETAKQSRELDWTPWLRTLCSRRLDLSSQLNPQYVATAAFFQTAQRWMLRLRMNQVDLMAESSTEESHAEIQRRKSLEQIDFMVSDLFRENRWTAQAWVNRCLEMLVQTNRVPLEECDHAAQHELADLLEEGLEIEVERLSERLGIDLDQSRCDAIYLLDETLTRLQQWINLRWMDSRSAWSHLTAMLQMVTKRFKEQGNSLCNVSHRLRLEHDRILETIHNEETPLGREENERLIEELDRLEIQARVHDIAGQLLERLGEHVTHLAEVWRAEAVNNYQCLNEFCIPLAEELDVRLTAKGLLKDTMMPLPAEWEPIRSKAASEFEEAFAHWLDQRRRDCLGSSHLKALQETQRNETTAFEGFSPQMESNQQVLLQDFKLNPVGLRELLDRVTEDSELECEGLGIAWDRNRQATGARPKSTSISNQVRESIPSLLQWGGAKRNILVLPSSDGDEAETRWRSLFAEPITIVRSSRIQTAMVVCDGEQMILPELVCRMWSPSTEKSDLANRVRSRTDVDWLPLECDG